METSTPSPFKLNKEKNIFVCDKLLVMIEILFKMDDEKLIKELMELKNIYNCIIESISENGDNNKFIPYRIHTHISTKYMTEEFKKSCLAKNVCDFEFVSNNYIHRSPLFQGVIDDKIKELKDLDIKRLSSTIHVDETFNVSIADIKNIESYLEHNDINIAVEYTKIYMILNKCKDILANTKLYMMNEFNKIGYAEVDESVEESFKQILSDIIKKCETMLTEVNNYSSYNIE